MSPWLPSGSISKGEEIEISCTSWGNKLDYFQLIFILDKHRHSPTQNPDFDIYNERKYKGFEVVAQLKYFGLGYNYSRIFKQE